jgi:hypothetical protein
VKVCKAEGLCTGNEEISIFVEKVNQSTRPYNYFNAMKESLSQYNCHILFSDDIGIRFFQNVDQYQWSAEAELTYVHHGLAIAFK